MIDILVVCSDLFVLNSWIWLKNRRTKWKTSVPTPIGLSMIQSSTADKLSDIFLILKVWSWFYNGTASQNFFSVLKKKHGDIFFKPRALAYFFAYISWYILWRSHPRIETFTEIFWGWKILENRRYRRTNNTLMNSVESGNFILYRATAYPSWSAGTWYKLHNPRLRADGVKVDIDPPIFKWAFMKTDRNWARMNSNCITLS